MWSYVLDEELFGFQAALRIPFSIKDSDVRSTGKNPGG